MIVEMKQLEYFVVCCDCGSFSKAAQLLYTTQPNVSRVICQMETQLGCTLFDRKGRGITLTDAGKGIYQYASSIIENAECIAQLLGQENRKIFSIASVPSNCMADTFKEWYIEHEEDYQQMRYLEGSIKSVIDYVRRYEAEVGFVYVSQQYMDDFLEMLKKRNLEFHKLSSERQVLAIGRQNPFYNEAVITKEMQNEMQFIHYQDRSLAVVQDVLMMNQVIDDDGFRHKVITNSENLILHLVRNTPLALLSVDRKSGTDEYLDSKIMRHVPLGDAEVETSFGYVVREDAQLGQNMKVFIQNACR
jgi:DNA-binding transcriptional LysR family regulator